MKAACVSVINVLIRFNQPLVIALSHIPNIHVIHRDIFLEERFCSLENTLFHFNGVVVNIEILNDLPLKRSFIGGIVVNTDCRKKAHRVTTTVDNL